MDPAKNGSGKYAEIPSIVVKEADVLIQQDGKLDIGSFSCQILHTPGHSPGSVTFYFQEDEFALVGDTLFQNSVGRTDLVGGNETELLKSIHSKLLSLPETTIVYPGHGAATTIEEEMDNNPFLTVFERFAYL